MTTIKSYTDISQSKKLAEILPLESADMIWALANPDLPMIKAIAYQDSDKDNKYYEILPAWSLAALEHLIWNTNVDAVSCPHIYKDRIANKYYFLYGNYETNTYPYIVDACYEMIIKLHELNLL